MKKIISTLLLVAALAWPAPASAFGFDWGVTGGLNLTKLKLSGAAKENFAASNRAGWFVGAKANLSIALGFGRRGNTSAASRAARRRGRSED